MSNLLVKKFILIIGFPINMELFLVHLKNRNSNEVKNIGILCGLCISVVFVWIIQYSMLGMSTNMAAYQRVVLLVVQVLKTGSA